jgi:MinD-like ATPase involved in chromosome partitioning or flagellar assembly
VNSRGQILAFASSKGGVGKTHLAVGLSAAMAKRGARVLLIDADLGNGIVSDRLGFYPKFSLVHFFKKERGLEHLAEQTPFGFFLIGGERGNFSLANLNYLQKMRFLRNFIAISKQFDYVVLDLSSGVNRLVIDFALLADKTIVVSSPHDLTSAYGSVRACFSRFVQLETRLSKRLSGYNVRHLFRPLILMNQVRDPSRGRKAFEAVESAVENRVNKGASAFRVDMGYLGAVVHDPRLFKKSEVRRCPVSRASVYSKVAFCVDTIAGAVTSSSPSHGFDRTKRLHYTLQMLMEHEERVRKGLTRKVMKIYPVKVSLRAQGQPVSPLH